MDAEMKELLGRVGLALVEWSGTGGAVKTSTTRGSLADHYSQESRDARQRPVLALFDPLDPNSAKVLPWTGPDGVKAVALKNGYTGSGLGGFFLKKNGLLTWVDETVGAETVAITAAGRMRFAEIEARVAAQAV